MSTTIILDDFPKDVSLQRRKKTQQVFIIIELALWALFGLGYMLKLLAFQYYDFFLLLGSGVLAIFYILCPIWLFGSVGWKRHIGSHLVGIALAGSILPIVFVIANWRGINEQVENGLKLSIIATITTLVVYFLQRNSSRGGQFFLAVLARTTPVMVILIVLSIFRPW